MNPSADLFTKDGLEEVFPTERERFQLAAKRYQPRTKCGEGDGNSKAWYLCEQTAGTAMNAAVTLLVCLCFGLFAYTCLIGFISFSEISAARISPRKGNIVFIRVLCLFVAAFGMVCNMAGYNLSNLWAFSDLGNILIVYFNIPLLYLGFRYVRKALAHYRRKDGTPFTEATVGLPLDDWKVEEVSRP